MDIPREIAVSADATVYLAADSVRITALIEETGAAAEISFAAATAKSKLVQEALKKVDRTVLLTTRGERVVDAASKSSTMSQNTAKRSEIYIAAETKDLSKAAALIDAAISAGAKEVSDVEYSSRGVQKAHLDAVQEATLRAKKKAELLASLLSVSLGKVLSANVIEQPAAEVLRFNNKRGVDVSHYNEKEFHVPVTLRFSLS